MSGKEKSRAPLAAFIVGTICPTMDLAAAGNPNMLRLTNYRTRLVDLGRLDALSPPWMRIGGKGAAPDPEKRSPAYVAQYANIFSNFLRHKATAAVEKVQKLHRSEVCRPTVAVKILSDSSCPGQIAAACSCRFEAVANGGESEEAVAEAKIEMEKMASEWANLFIKSALLPLSKGGVPKEWEACPKGLAKAALDLNLNGSIGAGADVLAQWAPAMLAQEQALSIAGAKLGKGNSVQKSQRRGL